MTEPKPKPFTPSEVAIRQVLFHSGDPAVWIMWYRWLGLKEYYTLIPMGTGERTRFLVDIAERLPDEYVAFKAWMRLTK